MAWYSHSEDARLIQLILRFDEKKERKMERKKKAGNHICGGGLTTALTSVLASLRCHHGQKDFSNDSRRKTKVKVVGDMLCILMGQTPVEWSMLDRLLDRLLHVRKGDKYGDKGQLYWISKTEPFEF